MAVPRDLGAHREHTRRRLIFQARKHMQFVLFCFFPPERYLNIKSWPENGQIVSIATFCDCCTFRKRERGYVSRPADLIWLDMEGV